MEIYNDKLYDLLGIDAKKKTKEQQLDIKIGSKETIIDNLTKIEVDSLEHSYDIIKSASRFRSTVIKARIYIRLAIC